MRFTALTTLGLGLMLAACQTQDNQLPVEGQPSPTVSPTLPGDGQQPNPSASPEPSTSPEPSASPEPSVSPEPSTSPEPSVSPEPEVRVLSLDASHNSQYMGLNLITGEEISDLEQGDWHIAMRRYQDLALSGGLLGGQHQLTAQLVAPQTEFYYEDGEIKDWLFLDAKAEDFLNLVTNPYSLDERKFVGESVHYAIGNYAPSMREANWGRYDMASGGHIYGNPERVWVINTGNPSANFYAIRVTADKITETRDTQFKPQIGLEVYESRRERGRVIFDQQPKIISGQLDAPRGKLHFDLIKGTASLDETQDWHLRFHVFGSGRNVNFNLELNGGVSGAGNVSAQGPISPAELAVLDAGGMYAMGFASDRLSNAFTQNPWFEYLMAHGHRMLPNYRVYAVDLDGRPETTDDRFLLQFIDYYHPETGLSGHYSIRVRQLD